MRASLVIPSYNASDRLYFNLLSLNFQDCSDFEVIVVDNGSTDDTAQMLSRFKANYPLKTVRIHQNRGIAYGRNQGIAQAKGDILIFHDSDMIAAKDFVRKHIEAHEDKQTVISGLFWRRIYSYYYDNFELVQKNHFMLFKNKYHYERRLENKNIIQFIHEHQIIDGSYSDYSFDLNYYPFFAELQMILSIYGNDLNVYHSPWRFFLTLNASANREKVLEVGWFDENIPCFGYEDYDLGIRLFKSGCKFQFRNDIVSVHQEHPKNFNVSDVDNIVKHNLNYLFEKYNNIYYIDIVLTLLNSLHVVPSLDDNHINRIVNDVKRILDLGQYNDLLEIYLMLLQKIKKAEIDKEYMKSSPDPTINYNYIKQRTSELRGLLDVSHFVNSLYGLIKWAYQVDLF